MKKVVLNIKENKLDFFMELIGYFDFVEVDEHDKKIREEHPAKDK